MLLHNVPSDRMKVITDDKLIFRFYFQFIIYILFQFILHLRTNLPWRVTPNPNGRSFKFEVTSLSHVANRDVNTFAGTWTDPDQGFFFVFFFPYQIFVAILWSPVS